MKDTPEINLNEESLKKAVVKSIGQANIWTSSALEQTFRAYLQAEVAAGRAKLGCAWNNESVSGMWTAYATLKDRELAIDEYPVLILRLDGVS